MAAQLVKMPNPPASETERQWWRIGWKWAWGFEWFWHNVGWVHKPQSGFFSANMLDPPSYNMPGAGASHSRDLNTTISFASALEPKRRGISQRYSTKPAPGIGGEKSETLDLCGNQKQHDLSISLVVSQVHKCYWVESLEHEVGCRQHEEDRNTHATLWDNSQSSVYLCRSFQGAVQRHSPQHLLQLTIPKPNSWSHMARNPVMWRLHQQQNKCQTMSAVKSNSLRYSKSSGIAVAGSTWWGKSMLGFSIWGRTLLD